MSGGKNIFSILLKSVSGGYELNYQKKQIDRKEAHNIHDYVQFTDL
jgi:hypothetical protein